MTVQELIDALNKVEDKSLPIYYYYNGLGDYEEIDEIEKNMRIVTCYCLKKILSMN